METNQETSTYTAFDGPKLLFQGPLDEVVLKIKKKLGRAQNNPYLIFSDTTGKTMDFDFQGSEKDVGKRLQVFIAELNPKESTGPGRPKLGVISREVSLLPRHWEWLAAQTGGASVSLRKLVEEAKKKSSASNSVKPAQERTHKFMSALAGDFAGFEEALRALYCRDEKNFKAQIAEWPKDVQIYALDLAGPVFAGESSK